ncbi:hypothetical protein Ancab_011086 [Ancistrocladus abbreviatus]
MQKGVVELVSQNRIGKLVMGRAADGRYSRKMIEPKSKKASYVRAQAPAFCHIWFICKGRLIHTSPSRCSTPKSIYVGGSYSEFDRSSTRTCSHSSTILTSSEVAGDSSLYFQQSGAVKLVQLWYLYPKLGKTTIVHR